MLTPFSQARWCEWHGRHKVQRSDWRGGQPLDITCSTCPEKGRKPLVLHQLSKPECHKEGLLSALKDQQHPRNTDRSKVVLYIRPEKWVMAGSTASWRQREDGLLHWANTVAINSHAFQPLPCPGDIWMANGVFLGRPDLQCWQPTMETTWLSNCKTHTHTTSPTKIWKWTVIAWRHYIWPVGQLSRFPRMWPSLVLPPYPEERKVTQAAVKLGQPIQCSNPNKCDWPNPAASKTILWCFRMSQTETGEGSI